MAAHITRSRYGYEFMSIHAVEATITATTPELRWMAMSRIVIRVDLAISNHLGYPSTHGEGLEG